MEPLELLSTVVVVEIAVVAAVVAVVVAVAVAVVAVAVAVVVAVVVAAELNLLQAAEWIVGKGVVAVVAQEAGPPEADVVVAAGPGLAVAMIAVVAGPEHIFKV